MQSITFQTSKQYCSTTMPSTATTARATKLIQMSTYAFFADSRIRLSVLFHFCSFSSSVSLPPSFSKHFFLPTRFSHNIYRCTAQSIASHSHCRTTRRIPFEFTRFHFCFCSLFSVHFIRSWTIRTGPISVFETRDLCLGILLKREYAKNIVLDTYKHTRSAMVRRQWTNRNS